MTASASRARATIRFVYAILLAVGSGPDSQAGGPPSPGDIQFLDQVSWGVSAESISRLQAIGRDRWLEAQLTGPPQPLPKAVQDRIAALPLAQRPMTALVVEAETQSRAANQIADPDQKKAAQQAVQQTMNEAARGAATRAILQALYGPDQLRERLAWFWFNHFNVHQGKANIRLMVGDYDEAAIRPNVLGRFRTLLEATLRHPAMLRYLDNAENAGGRLNENYARELLELHTMGVGSGYTQTDVEELARILTGVGIDTKPEDPKLRPELQPQLIRQGLFAFNPARHDYGDKTFLGHAIQGRGFAEVEEALDILARHPATAARISRLLATYFMADAPPEPMIKRMSAEYARSDGSIAAVLRVLFRAPEFQASLGTRFKDPARFVFSALRLAYDERVILNTRPVEGWLNRLAEGLFNHQTPDGYSLLSSAWNGPGQMVMRFEIARQIGSNAAGLFKADGPDAVEQPAFPLLQNGLYFSALRDKLSVSTRAALDRAVSPQDWNALFLSSPEFMQ